MDMDLGVSSGLGINNLQEITTAGPSYIIASISIRHLQTTKEMEMLPIF